MLAGNNIGAWTVVQCATGYAWSDGSGNYPANYTCTADATNLTFAGTWLVNGSYLTCQRECFITIHVT